ELIPKLAGDLTPQHTLGIPTVLSWKYDPNLGAKGATAYTYAVNAQNQFTGQVALCAIYLNKTAITQLGAYDLHVALAHELMHCFQADIVSDLNRWYHAVPGWISDGEAMWVGFKYGDEVGGGPSVEYGDHWRAWFYENLTPLFKRTYDAV